MPVHNAEIAHIFKQVADLLEIEGANQFRVRAYRDAARTIDTLSQSVAEMVKKEQNLSELPGIGEDLAGKIEEIVNSGHLAQLAELKERVPPELAELMHISGLGPKRIQTLHKELGINTRADLEQAARQGKIRQLHGFGEKIEQGILEDLEEAQTDEKRTKLVEAEQIVKLLLTYLQDSGDIEELIVAGSYRRRKETVGDLDVLATSQRGEKIMERFVQYEDVDDVVSKGETRSTIVIRSGLHIDLRVVPQESYGAALLYFTGSKAHNITLRNMALARDLKINEYGVFKGDQAIAGKTEVEIYNLLDLPYIVPELREDRGEIEAAQNDQLPELITLEDIRGDLQSHTKASDGRNTLEEMAEAARKRGYEYLAITDHSPHVAVTHGLNVERLQRQIEAIDQLNEQLADIVLLKSIEVDILADGSLDLPDEILQELDLVVCSIHSQFDLSEEKQTERVIRALDNPYCHILAHPTGRRLGERQPYALDVERVLEAALERGCFLELNAQPERLDLNDVFCQMAKEKGVKLAISTDAHRLAELDNMRFGVDQARRGWLEADDVLNARHLSDLKKLLRRA